MDGKPVVPAVSKSTEFLLRDLRLYSQTPTAMTRMSTKMGIGPPDAWFCVALRKITQNSILSHGTDHCSVAGLRVSRDTRMATTDPHEGGRNPPSLALAVEGQADHTASAGGWLSGESTGPPQAITVPAVRDTPSFLLDPLLAAVA